MASTKIRGITIELGADTTGLKKALEDVDKSAKSTQKQLRDVERLLKLDPTNTELLAQKQRLLAENVTKTEEKLKALKQAQEQFSDEMLKTEEGRAQYDALSREIMVTERDLKEAERAAAEFNSTSKKIADTADKIAGKFNTVAQKTKTLSKVAGGALAAMGALAIKTAQTADELNTMAKQTGLSTAELQKMQYASELIDVDTDTIVGGLKKLKKNLTATNAPFEELGIQTKNAKGEFRDISDIFYDTIEALGKIENETERDTVAMQLFGKSADELAGIIDDGGAALRELGAEAENLGLIIPQEDLDKANELNDAIDKLKTEATGTFAEIGIEIAEMLMPYLPKIKEAIKSVLQALRDMDPSTLGLIAKCAGIVAAISPIASVCSTAASSVSFLSKALSGIGASAGISGGIFALIAVAILEFIAAVSLATTKAQEWDAAWNTAWAKVFTLFRTGADWCREHLALIGDGVAQLIDTTRNIFESFMKMMEGLIKAVSSAIKGDWEGMWKGLKQAALAYIDEILNATLGLANGVIGAINGIIDAINRLGNANIQKLGSLRVSLVDKFMATGGTISNGSAIVGEAGPEILTVAGGSATVTPLTSAGGDTNVIGLLETYLPYLAAGNTLVLDSGALVGGIAPDMNAALGTIAIRGGRR